MKLRIGLAIVIFSIFSIFKLSYAAPANLPEPVGRVVWVKGMLIATMSNEEQRILKKKSVIYLGDTLSTDEKSRAEIVFTDNTLMTFRKSTTYKVEAYALGKGKKKGAGKFVGDVVKGGFRTITGLIAEKNPENYKVKTPVATIGVRGTDYEVAVKDGEVFVGFFKGKPCVTNKPTSDSKNKVVKAVCLSKDSKYAKVGVDGSVPVPLAQKPVVFNEVLVITPATISPFSYGNIQGGVISSFCIQ